MAVSQEQVDAWFAANPNATAEDVAAAVQSIGGLEANQGLAGMIANRYSIAEPEVTNYYNAYTAPKADTPVKQDTQTFTDTITSGADTTEQDLLNIVGAPADNITSTGGYTKSATAPTSGGVSNVVEGDDIDTQIAQLPEEYAHWSRSADQRYMELIRKSDGAVLDRRAVGDFSDLDLVKMGLSFVPGAGQVLAAVNIADAVRTGDLTKAAIGLTGLDSSLANVNTALKVGQAVDQNNPFGAITALAGNTDLQKLTGFDTATVGGFTAKDATAAANLTKAAIDGNTAGVLTSLGTLTGSSDTVLAGRALNLITRIQNGDTRALADAVSLSNSVSGSNSSSSTGSTTVGDFEDTEVTRLKGLGYTNQQIQDYFNNLDNLTGALDETTTTIQADANLFNNSLGTLDQLDTTRTADEYADFLASIGITNTDQLADSGLSNQDILDLINATDDTLTVTGKKSTDTVTDTDTSTGGTGDDNVPELVVKDKRECAPGFHDDGTGLCVADTDLNCEEGYEPNEAGTACIPVVEIKDTRCDPGFVYDEDLKQCVAIKGDEPCAEGYHRDEATGLCVPDDDGRCEDGYEKVNGACVPVCADGYVRNLETGVCEKVEDECPTGYHRDEVTGQCVPDTTTLNCPEGYEPNEAGTACIPVVVIKDTRCDPGFVYDEDLKQCVPIKDDEPCAEGFHLENGICVPDDDDRCQDGYEKVNGACVPVCAEGYIRNLATGVCEKVEDKPCPPGQVKNAEGKCVPIVTPPPPVVKTTPTTFVPSTGVATSGEKTDPIYAEGMDAFDLFATLQELLAEEPKKKDSKKSKEKTKMATGGHLDDLLAEQMTVDDLLKLLR
jgi:hypothetical protein